MKKRLKITEAILHCKDITGKKPKEIRKEIREAWWPDSTNLRQKTNLSNYEHGRNTYFNVEMILKLYEITGFDLYELIGIEKQEYEK